MFYRASFYKISILSQYCRVCIYIWRVYITSVFATFNAILFVFSQNENSFRAMFRLLLILEIVFWILSRHVSSAKWKDCGNFRSNMLWSTVSNAFCKSTKTPQTNFLLSIAFSIFSIRLITACAHVVEIFFWNPKLIEPFGYSKIPLTFYA